MKNLNTRLILIIFLFFTSSCNKTSSSSNSLNTANNQPPPSNQCSTSSSTKARSIKMQNRVIDGIPVTDPTQVVGGTSNVAIIIQDPCYPQAWSLCTGTFISDHVVLTAAHCFKNQNQPAKVTGVNNFDLSKPDDGIPNQNFATVQKIKINEFFLNYCTPYPEENRDTMICSIGDIALVNTDKSAAQIGATVAKVTTITPPPTTVVNFLGYGIDPDDASTYPNNPSPIFKKRSGTAQVFTYDATTFNDTKITSPTATSTAPYINAPTVGTLLADSVVQTFSPSVPDPKIFPNLYSTLIFMQGRTAPNNTGLCPGDSGSSIYVNVAGSAAEAGSSSYAAVAITHDSYGTPPAGYPSTQICAAKLMFNLAIAPYVNWINANMFGEGPLQTIP